MTAAAAGRGGLILIACALGLDAAGAPAPFQRGKQRDAPAVAPFQGTLAEARTLATDRNVPLLVVAIYEDEAWDPGAHHDQVEMRRVVLEDRELAAGLQRAVVALACNRTHPLEEVEVGDGEAKRSVRRCPSYRTDSCAVHQRLFEDAYVAWNRDGALVSPHVVVLAPDGEIASLWADGSSPSHKDLASAVQRASKAAGRGLTAEEHGRVLALGADARQAVERGRHLAAWRAWDALLAIPQDTRFAEEARAGLAAAEQGLAAAREAAQAEVAAGRPVEGYRRLVELAQDSSGTPFERELAAQVRQLETDSEHREAIQAYKRELAAEAIVGEIEAALREGDDKRASAKLKGLLRRYGDTQAAARARERWPDLSAGA